MSKRQHSDYINIIRLVRKPIEPRSPLRHHDIRSDILFVSDGRSNLQRGLQIFFPLVVSDQGASWTALLQTKTAALHGSAIDPVRGGVFEQFQRILAKRDAPTMNM